MAWPLSSFGHSVPMLFSAPLCALWILSLQPSTISYAAPPPFEITISRHFSPTVPHSLNLGFRPADASTAQHDSMTVAHSPFWHVGCLALRGGEAEKLDVDVSKWSSAHVQKWISTFNNDLGTENQAYIKHFEDKKVDGKSLLSIDLSELAKLGVSVPAHREFLLRRIIELRKRMGMPTGPDPKIFAEAMAAQCSAPHNPPRLIFNSSIITKPEDTWKTISNVAWSQDDRTVEYRVYLDRVGNVLRDNLEVDILEESIVLRVRDLNGTNYFHSVPKLWAKILPENSSFKVRMDRVDFKLRKYKRDYWDGMHCDSRGRAEGLEVDKALAEKGPEAGLMQLMQQIYASGDQNTKAGIKKAYHEAVLQREPGGNGSMGPTS